MASNQTKSLARAASALKKILAAGPDPQGESRLRGAFYFCSGRGVHGLVVTLQRRDPDGMRALRRGKELRRELEAGKFVRGVVTYTQGKRPQFTIHAGNASKQHLRDGLRKHLATQPDLAFLRRASVCAADEFGADADDELEAGLGEEEGEITSSLQLQDEDRKDLADLLAEPTPLAAQNADLDRFLSQADAEDEVEEILLETTQQLALLRAEAAPDPEQIALLQGVLAQAAQRGPSPAPKPGQQLSPELQHLLDMAGRRVAERLTRRLRHLENTVERLDQEARELDALQRLRSAAPRVGALRVTIAQLQELSGTLGAILPDRPPLLERARQAIELAGQTLEALEAPADGFQLLVRGVKSSLVVLEDCLPSMTLSDILYRLEDKLGSGLAFADASLSASSGALQEGVTLQALGVSAGSTLHFNVRGRGGYGEYDAVDTTMGMRRGNVRQQIRQTRGESRVLLDWVRRQNKLVGELHDIAAAHGVNPLHPVMELQIRALMQMTAGAGNCGEFSSAVAAALSAQAPDPPDALQYAYRVYMYPGRKDVSRRDPYQTFDHALCVTYPEPLDIEFVSEWPDLNKATIADGWANNMVCTAADFMEGQNAYGARLRGRQVGDLRVREGPIPCTGEALPDDAREAMVAHIEQKLNRFKRRIDFKLQCLAAWANQAGLFRFPVEQAVEDHRTALDISNKLEAVLDHRSFPAEVLELSDEQIFELLQGKYTIVERMFQFHSICARLWGILLALDNRELSRVTASYLSDAQLQLFASSSRRAAERLDEVPTTRHRLAQIRRHRSASSGSDSGSASAYSSGSDPASGSSSGSTSSSTASYSGSDSGPTRSDSSSGSDSGPDWGHIDHYFDRTYRSGM